MTTEQALAETFAPGEFIRDEIEARGWTQLDLAEIIGRTPAVVNELIMGKRAVTPETAKALEQALGISAQFWMNVEARWQLSRTRTGDPNISRRAALYSKAPVKEMIRRGWIDGSTNVEVLERQVLDFLECKHLGDEIVFPHAARKSNPYKEATSSEFAWLFCAKKLARAVTVAAYSESRFESVLEALRPLLLSAPELRHVPRVLSEHGIRLVIVEHLSKTRVDGAAFWINERTPVIVLSFRYDRIDWFWFTLMHELDHVRHREGSIDSELVGKDAKPSEEKPEQERRADEFASNFLVSGDERAGFVRRVHPLYSKLKIRGFAARLQIHPGIAVGQLQHHRNIDWSHSREMLVKVRHLLTEATVTDGFGSRLASRM